MPDQFWNLTMREFRLMQTGYLEKLADEQIHNWDLIRTLCAYTISPHLKKGKSIKPKDIMKLPIDKKQESHDDITKRRQQAIFDLKRHERIKAKQTKDKKEGKNTNPFIGNKNG